MPAPTNLTASTGLAGEIVLYWQDNSSEESWFRVESSTNGTSFLVIPGAAANATTCTVRNLIPGKKYYFRVSACKSTVVYSVYSNIAAAVPASLPAPTGLTASAVAGRQIKLSWTDTSTQENGFKIERSTSPTTGFAQIATTFVNSTSYANTGLTSGRTYYYRVRAYNNFLGYSAYSNLVSAVAVN